MIMAKGKEPMEISVKLPKGLYGTLLQISDRDNVNMDDLLTDIVEDYFESGDEPEVNPNENPEE